MAGHHQKPISLPHHGVPYHEGKIKPTDEDLTRAVVNKEVVNFFLVLPQAVTHPSIRLYKMHIVGTPPLFRVEVTRRFI